MSTKKVTKAFLIRKYFGKSKKTIPSFSATREHMDKLGQKISPAQYYQIRKAFYGTKSAAASAASKKATKSALTDKLEAAIGVDGEHCIYHTLPVDSGVSAIQFRDELAKLKLSVEKQMSPEALAEACRSVFKV